MLNELPEKTEVTRKVQLSPEEWALYDNIRQKALINLADGEATPLQTLTELTRLRQAACNAQLIDKKLRIPSSKEAVFLEMVDSLHDNHHRALVFSQFTSHLALIRKALDKRGIEYLYLDGATPAKERDKLVREFQTGDMPSRSKPLTVPTASDSRILSRSTVSSLREPSRRRSSNSIRARSLSPTRSLRAAILVPNYQRMNCCNCSGRTVSMRRSLTPKQPHPQTPLQQPHPQTPLPRRGE